MSRRALAIAAAAALLFEAQARADAAQQAMGGLGAFLLPGLCAFVATGISELEAQEGEAAAEEAGRAGEGAEQQAAQAKAASRAAAKAEGETRFDRSGWLAGALASFQFEDFKHLGPLDADDSVGMKLRLGYRCSPHLGWEFNYEWAESFDISDGSDVDLWALTSDAKWYPLTGRWQPFLLAGVGVLTADPIDEGTGTDITLRFGGGMEAYVTENVALAFDASYVLPTSKVKDLPYLSLSWGFLYRF
jgi:opacity protein-like surface antigen